MIEQNTNYAYKLKYMDNPTFDKVRDLSTKFYRELPQALQDELFEALNRGIDILDSEPQMTTYLFAFGKMHQAKLEYAFSKLPNEFLEQPEINIIDYGCGQALGTMCYADFLREKGYSQKVKTITLIEPSEICLKRAALHVSVFFPDAEIKTANKKFDNLTQDDIICCEETPTLHILSNVFDMLNFDLDGFSALIKDSLNGYNQFVCVGPYFNYSVKDERMKKFCSIIQAIESYFKTFDKNEFDKERTWTAQILCFAIGSLEEGNLSTEITEEEINNGIEDEFGVVYSRNRKKLLKCKNRFLKKYEIREGTKIICRSAFTRFTENPFDEAHSSLQQITIPNSVVSIGRYAFLNCSSLQQVTMSDSISNIDDCAFCNCLSLQQITIPDTVTYFGNGVFSNCSSLQQFIIPNSVEEISWRLFYGCQSLQQITIPDDITFIGGFAFFGCQSLLHITIPNSIEEIGIAAFNKCRKLTLTSKSSRFSIHGGLIIDNLYNEVVSCTCKYDNERIPNTVTSIGDHAFFECSSLQSIIIPDSIIQIGEAAFNNCSKLILISESPRFSVQNGLLIDTQYNKIISYTNKYNNLIIPNSVTSIGDFAFEHCSSLQQITIPDSVTSIGDWVFSECESLKQIIIPKNSVEKFKQLLPERLWDKLYYLQNASNDCSDDCCSFPF